MMARLMHVLLIAGMLAFGAPVEVAEGAAAENGDSAAENQGAVAEIGSMAGESQGAVADDEGVITDNQDTAGENSTGTWFSDVPGVHWAYDAIQTAVEKGYVSGYTDGTFKPNREVTRAEFMRMLVDALNLPHSQGGSPWYQPYVAALIETGIHFESDFDEYKSPISRLEMARLVARSLAVQSEYADLLDVFAYLKSEHLPFTDGKSITNADVPLVALAYGAEIVSGYPDGSYRASQRATRADAVLMLINLNAAIQTAAEQFTRIKDLRTVAEANGAPLKDQVSLQDFLFEVVAQTDPCLCDPVQSAKDAGIFIGEVTNQNQGVTRLEAARILSGALALNAEYRTYLKKFEALYNGDIPVLEWKQIAREDVPYVALIYGTGIIDRDKNDASFGLEKRILRSELAGIMERFREARAKRPNDYQYLREFKEVAETGMNAKAVANLQVMRNLQEDPLVVEHITDHVTTLKRLYIIPLTGNVVSMYERMFVWERNDLYQYAGNDELDAIVVGVADVTFKRDRGAYGTNLMITPFGIVSPQASDIFGFANEFSFNYVPSKKGETKTVVLYGGYNKTRPGIDLQLLNSLHRFNGHLLKNLDFIPGSNFR